LKIQTAVKQIIHLFIHSFVCSLHYVVIGCIYNIFLLSFILLPVYREVEYFFRTKKVLPIPTYEQYITLKTIVLQKMAAKNRATPAAIYPPLMDNRYWQTAQYGLTSPALIQGRQWKWS